MAGYIESGSQYTDRPRQSQEQVPREPHQLSLKVLRASRPSFTQAKDVFRDETSTLHSASTSGFTLTPLLALPTAFGNINLGETFQGLILAANDSPQDVYDASLRIEIQTANSRTTLWESPPPEQSNPRILKPGDSLEAPLLRYEIKEPGLHALSCSVSYWAQTRNLSFTPQPGAGDRHARSFRKLYKFQASNPLAVKTKIHNSKNAAAQLDEEIASTVFLEVQIQNTSPEPLLLERLLFNPSENQEVEDVTSLPKGQLQPGDLLHCLYIVRAQKGRHQELVEKARHAGGLLPLGKLDIRWRSRMGDFGHLATSQLNRRLPQHVLPPQLSARSSMQNLRASLNAHHTPEQQASASSRDHSPMQSPQIALTAGFSPAASPRLQQTEPRSQHVQSKDLRVDLSVLPFESRSVKACQPFAVDFKLSITSLLREGVAKTSTTKARRLKLVVQHVRHSNAESEVAPQAYVGSRASIGSRTLPNLTPSQSTRTSMETDRPPPSIILPHEHSELNYGQIISLPPPRPLSPDDPFFVPAADVPWIFAVPDPECHYYGNTLMYLDDIEITHNSQPTESLQTGFVARESLDSASTTDEMPLEEMMRMKSTKGAETIHKEFQLKYIASTAGIFKLGGVRVILLEDKWHDAGDQADISFVDGVPPCTLLEHVVVAEVTAEF